VNLGRRFDLNHKLTNLSVGLSYTASDTAATLDHDATPYLTKTAYREQLDNSGGAQILHGHRQDWSASLGLVQVLNAATLYAGKLDFTRSQGYLANPYKATTVIFADPAAPLAGGLLNGDVEALLEQRPRHRQQWSLAHSLLHHLTDFDAALRLAYRYTRDDWASPWITAGRSPPACATTAKAPPASTPPIWFPTRPTARSALAPTTRSASALSTPTGSPPTSPATSDWRVLAA
jgi:hypothetical protein